MIHLNAGGDSEKTGGITVVPERKVEVASASDSDYKLPKNQGFYQNNEFSQVDTVNVSSKSIGIAASQYHNPTEITKRSGVKDDPNIT